MKWVVDNLARSDRPGRWLLALVLVPLWGASSCGAHSVCRQWCDTAEARAVYPMGLPAQCVCIVEQRVLVPAQQLDQAAPQPPWRGPL